MSRKPETIISLDPLQQKKQLGLIEKLIRSRWHGGKEVKKTPEYGHYMFCGAQRKGKTASILWYMEHLGKKYKKKGYKVRVWSNINIGIETNKEKLFKQIDELDPYEKEVRFFLIDEIHTYFPKGNIDKKTQQQINDLNAVFSQLGKRNCYVLSTAQLYGRLDKALREQCLYMINCRISFRNKLINEFIPQEDILCDELGRWAGKPKVIHIHGLAKTTYDTKRLIRE